MIERYRPARFLRRLGAVPEPAMREALWRECLHAVEPSDVVEIIQAVFTSLDAAQPDGRLAWLSLLRVVDPLRGGPLLIAIYLAAKTANATRVLGLLVDPPPVPAAHPETLRRPPLDAERDVTLGERRAWARRPDRATVEKLLFDLDPQVIRNVLANPRVIEADVVRLAARRPNVSAVLLEVFLHPRWGRRLPVLLALVYNPYTPVDLACGLVDWLDLGTARAVADSPGVHRLVREAAARRVRS